MHIICPREELQKGVSIVSKAVSNKTTMPILECILIQTKEGRILMTANDMELGIETEIHGIIEDNGRIAIDAKIFSEIVRRLPDNDISIETDGTDSVKIQCEKINFTIPGKNADEFTFLPEVERLNCVTLSQFTLKEIIRQTIFSISDNENNKMMAGELLEINGNNLRIVSLDGHRISIRKIVLKDSYDSIKVVVPGKTLNEVNKILLDSFEPVKIGISKNQALFEMDNCKIVTRILDGEFLNYKNVIPNTWETRIRVNRSNLQDCFERISLISSSSVEKEKKYPVKVVVDIGKVTISCTNQTGDAKEELFISTEGKNLEAGFNPKYFLDSLKVIDDEEVYVEFGSSISPCLIKSTENNDYVYMILPIRIKED